MDVIYSYNQNVLMDKLIGTTTLSLPDVVRNGGFVDTHLNVNTEGKIHGTLHVSVRILSGRILFEKNVIDRNA